MNNEEVTIAEATTTPSPVETKQTAAAKPQFTKEERAAYLEKKNQIRIAKLIETGYTEVNSSNIAAYAKAHRGYGARHYGDLCSRAFCGIVYGFKFHIWPFGDNLVKEIHQTCIDFLDNYARIQEGEEILNKEGKPLTVDTLISNFTTPRTPIGRAMYTISRRCEEGEEFSLQMVYLCEAIVDLLNTDEKLFEPFYHAERIDDPARPRKEFVRKCRSCGQPLTKNERGYWDCTNKDCKEFWDPEKRSFKKAAESDVVPEGEAIPTGEENLPRRPNRKFSNKDRAKYDAGKYKKGGNKKGGKPREFGHRSAGTPLGENPFGGLEFGQDGNLNIK